MFRLHLDESGDHDLSSRVSAGQRYLGLVGVIFDRSSFAEFTVALDALKWTHLRYDLENPPILHRVDIVKAAGPFAPLQDPARRRAFDDDLLELIEATPFRVVAVVVDKMSHGSKFYRRTQHPYHYGLEAHLERYCGWLKFVGGRGDVIAEARTKAEDRLLSTVYRKLYTDGARYLPSPLAQATLTSRELKLAAKCKNNAGLQLADVLAHPLTRDILQRKSRVRGGGGPFAEAVARTCEAKYNRQEYTSEVEGYGRIFLS